MLKASRVMHRSTLASLVLFGVAFLLTGCGSGGAGEVLHSGDAIVLVGAEGDSDEAMAGVGFSGDVAMVGACIGIDDVTVIWPYGTKIATQHPLTIDVPGLGRLKVGEHADGGADLYGHHLPKRIDAIPSDCPTQRVIAFYPNH